ncbi:MAG: sigma-70 family RNA polymerase sigma factor [Candidatus Moraniibacteriota bacterium]
MNDLQQLTDEALAVHVRTVDQESYRELVLRYEDRLRRYAFHLSRDEMRAADIVQEAFLKAFINLQSFNPERQFSTWIYRIVHNEAMNLLGKQAREIALPEDFDVASSEDIIADLASEEFRRQVETCIAEMPLLYAEPLALAVFDGRSYEEISDILRLPLGTVGTRIRRAKLLMHTLCQTKHR